MKQYGFRGYIQNIIVKMHGGNGYTLCDTIQVILKHIEQYFMLLWNIIIFIIQTLKYAANWGTWVP